MNYASLCMQVFHNRNYIAQMFFTCPETRHAAVNDCTCWLLFFGLYRTVVRLIMQVLCYQSSLSMYNSTGKLMSSEVLNSYRSLFVNHFSTNWYIQKISLVRDVSYEIMEQICTLVTSIRKLSLFFPNGKPKWNKKFHLWIYMSLQSQKAGCT